MSARLQIKYFNSFWLKKALNGRFNESGATSGSTLPTTASTGIIGTSYRPTWPGNSQDPSGYPIYPADTYINAESDTRNWMIEESRIRGGYNNTSTSYGARAYLKEDENKQSRLDNQIIYSGVYNSTTSFNATNVFSVADNIIKALDPAYGSIQRLYAEDTNMIIFQENKVNNVLVDKDAIYSAQGGDIKTSANLVLGQITPYLGEYGISKNPESFAVFGYRKYFVDRYRNSVLRLSRDGITEISQYGMGDYFRDNLSQISDQWRNYVVEYEITNYGTSGTGLYYITVTPKPEDVEVGMSVSIPQVTGSNVNTIVTGFDNNNIYIQVDPKTPLVGVDAVFTKFVKDEVLGGYDQYDDFYKVSMQRAILDNETPESFLSLIEGGNTQTLTFDESVKGWTSFYTYRPLFIDSLRNNYYTFKGADVWRHHDEVSNNRTTFYGTQSDSSITFVFNSNPSIMKNFNTINYEGNSGWEVDSIESDLENGIQDVTNMVKSYEEGKYTDGGVTYRSGFNRKENRYVANLINNSTQKIGEVVFGNQMSGVKGYYVTVKMSLDATTDPGGVKELFAVSSNFVVSSY